MRGFLFHQDGVTGAVSPEKQHKRGPRVRNEGFQDTGHQMGTGMSETGRNKVSLPISPAYCLEAWKGPRRTPKTSRGGLELRGRPRCLELTAQMTREERAARREPWSRAERPLCTLSSQCTCHGKLPEAGKKPQKGSEATAPSAQRTGSSCLHQADRKTSWLTHTGESTQYLSQEWGIISTQLNGALLLP